jgi:pimeloyl-ACP methyl ester carboxylesterase
LRSKAACVSGLSRRELAPRLAGAGYRVAAMDIRGHGESRTGWDSYTRAEVAGDILALIGHLGGPATIVGHSFAGGSAVIAAARRHRRGASRADDRTRPHGAVGQLPIIGRSSTLHDLNANHAGLAAYLDPGLAAGAVCQPER